jgi:hypothetical protein
MTIFEHQVADHRGPGHHIEITMEDDLARPDERVVEPTDLLVPDVWTRAIGILDPTVGGEECDPCRAVVDVGRGG